MITVMSGIECAAYPDKPVRLIVPFPAGGATDVMARGMAQQLCTELSQQIIVDNRGRADGTIAAEASPSRRRTLHAVFRHNGHPSNQPGDP